MYATYICGYHLNIPAAGYEGHAIGDNQDAFDNKTQCQQFWAGAGGGDMAGSKVNNQEIK
jgi:hypothetical protein